jgi:four helix bundle protein
VRRKHHQLEVWQQAIALVKDIYQLTASFPQQENYALASQMRRAAISVPSNIAEGAARTGDREFLKFLSIARGSLSELETQVIIAKELSYLTDDAEIMGRLEKVFGLLGGLMKSVESRNMS